MATRKTLNFLPEIFRSDTNKKFLGATLDQLISEPNLSKIDGFVGRKFSSTFTPSNNYVIEPTDDRQNYQFEPAVVVKNSSNGLDFYSDYKDLIDKISYYGGITTDQDRLFRSEYYSYTPRIDLDKFVNYTRYYWLPDGPDAVTLTAGTPATPKTFAVSKVVNSYRTNQTGTVNNPDITLVRGVTYQFNLGQSGFWIQTEPGTDGIKDYNTQVSSRSVFGVTNNGSQAVTFTVPARDAQDHYLASPLIDYVDFVVPFNPNPAQIAQNLTFSDIDASYLGVGGGTNIIDGSTRYANNAIIAFLNNSTDPQDPNWVDRTGNFVPVNKRRGLWKITTEFNGQITLVYVREVDIGDRIRPRYGDSAGNEYFKNVNGEFVPAPQVTAPMSVLYYQDGTTASMKGKIIIVDEPGTPIDVDTDIIGKKSYTSFSGIRLSNGMKIQFDSTITPSSYYGKQYIVEGVGVSIKLIDFDKLPTTESTAPESTVPFDTLGFDMGRFDEPVQGVIEPEYIIMNRACQDSNAWARTNRWFHEDVIAKTAEYNSTTMSDIKASRAQRPILEFEADLQLFNHGRTLLDIIDRADEKVVTIANSSTWADVTDVFAQINNKTVSDPDIKNMNFQEGQLAIFPNEVDLAVRKNIYRIDFKDQTQTIIFDGNGVGVINTSRNDTRVTGGPNFRTELETGSVIYSDGLYVGKVAYVENESTLVLEAPPAMDLTDAEYTYNKPRIELAVHKIAVAYDSVTVVSGVNKKRSYWFNGTNWIVSQAKTMTNQEPLFDVIDAVGNSFGDKTIYPKSEFAGTKIFSYKRGSSSLDMVLGFSLSYSNIGNSIADINFTNNFETDTFTWWPSLPATKSVSSGYLRKNINLVDYDRVNVWATVAEPSKQYQHISAVFDGQTRYFEIDIVPETETNEPNIKVFVNNIIIDRTDFTIETIGIRRAVYIETHAMDIGDTVDILIYSNETSDLGYYQIPSNLEFNALNQSIETITLGQVRGHWSTIGRNTRGVIGEVLSINNLRDLDTRFQSGSILQHSAPTVYSSLFLIDSQINFMNSIELARRDYTKFKNKFLELCLTSNDIDPNNPVDGVDIILRTINYVKNATFAWHYSDMVPWSENHVTDTYKIVDLSVRAYSIANGYSTVGEELYPSFGLSNKAVLVYLNGVQLVIGKDYTLSSGSPTVTLTSAVTLNYQDILTIKTYRNTDGSYVPETPAKLGLAPKYMPSMYTDNTYRDAVQVIQGHDGSITPAFNDLRDAYLLELEKRIYNNIKVSYRAELFDINSVVPGKFRNNDYSITEFNKVVATEFLKWIGNNQLDFSTNSYFQPNDQFSWNYNRTIDADGETLPGYWRGIYKYYYDTDRPHTHPWEMLGLTIKPTWWDSTYGAAPYRNNNSMWADLELGYIRGTNTTVSTYARPGLSAFIPVDANGALIPPQDKLVRTFDGAEFSQSYAVGDHGPVESAWRRSSDYPFALQRALSLLKPAKYFGLLFDVTAYTKDTVLDQYILASNKRVSPSAIEINGELVGENTTRASSYINWIHGYLTNLGLDAAVKIRNALSNLDVKLGYKVAGYTDKKYITALVEQFSPTSTNQSVIIPDENYIVHLNKSVPIRRATYSAVIVEKTTTGYAINGYNLKNPYFTVIPSEFNGNYYSIEALTAKATIFQDFKNQKVSVPYGYEFANKQQVVDFLVGYQRFLVSQGFVFSKYDADLKQTGDWILSAREFLTWSLQGWKPGNVIVLSPVSNALTIFGIDAVVDGITNLTTDSQLLGPNFNVIRLDEATVLREPSLTTITTTSGQTIAYADLNLVQYEHALVFDNVTVFNDIVYKPELGSRQYRLKLIGSRTADWTGELNPPGFMYQTGQIDAWEPEHDYVKADIVRYKNQNYTAIADIPGSATFKFDEWSILDSQIESGLVPNFATNASKFIDIYDIDSQALDENFDKFSNGLIGYRSRPYLEDLGMDQTTQSKFYQGYIKSKGTKNSLASLFSGQFDNLSNSLSIYEEWGLRVGEYGALTSNQSIELIVDEADYRSNPIVFKFLNSGDVSTDTIKTLRPKDLANRPLNYKSPIFLNRQLGEEDETDVKSAGYVNVNDVDVQLFDFNNYTDLTTTALANLTTGYRIWVAKDFNDEWQVYQVTRTTNAVVAIEYSLDNKAKITMDHDHGLQINDVFAIRNFATGFDGFYQVLNVETSDTLVCIIPDALIPTLLRDNVEGAGELFTLQKSRYRTIAERDADITKSFHTTGNRVWVDNNGANLWAIYDYESGSAGNFSGPHSFWGIENQSITLRTTGIPYHTRGNVSMATPVTEQYYNRTWPLNAGANVAATVSTVTGSGVVGFWLNGVAIVSPNAGTVTPPGYLTAPGLTYNLGYGNYNFNVDRAGGTTTSEGVYHYYGYDFARAWATGSGATDSSSSDAESNVIRYLGGMLAHDNGHSKIMGFALDGYPVYGPFGYDNTNGSIRRMITGYSLRDPAYRETTEACDLTTYPMGMFIEDFVFDGQGDLDRHNGRYCVTPDYPNGTYAYFTTMDSTGDSTYPYAIGPTYYGPIPEVGNSLIGGAGQPPLTFTSMSDVVWTTAKTQTVTVDNNSIAGMYLFDNVNKKMLARLDYVDPRKGKVLGTAQADLDFVSTFDPAKYNQGTLDQLPIEEDYHWGEKQIGSVWWDIDAVRYYDYEQDTLEYRVEYWGKTFPGSSIHVYEWIASNVLPSAYVSSGGDGIPKYADDSAYVAMTYVDANTGVIKTKYYFWVRNKVAKTTLSKTHSVNALADIIANPLTQNIPYAAVLKDNSVALYNVGSYLSGASTSLHINYRTKLSDNIVHSEYDLFQQGNESAVMHPRIETKLIDSIVGSDEFGNRVPDPSLLPGDRIGLSNKPRQTLIANRLKAVENIVSFVNLVLKEFPVSSRLINKDLVYSDNFFAEEAIPATTDYDYAVDTFDQISYIPSATAGTFAVGKRYTIVSLGTTDWNAAAGTTGVVYAVGSTFTTANAGIGSGTAILSRILVKQDSGYNNRWTVYTNQLSGVPTLLKTQTYNTKNFWHYADWYAIGYSSKTIVINYTVEKYHNILTLDLVPGNIVKVTNNDAGLFEVYKLGTNGKLELIALQNGTIQLGTALQTEVGFDHDTFDIDLFDYNSFNEFRYILKGLKEDVFVKDLAIYYNQLLFFVIEYILSEQKYVDWIFKTSFISIAHKLEGLIQTSSYVKDRQGFYESFIKEVKPYRTKIREYTMAYTKTEVLDRATVTDFDLPAYYDSAIGTFRSPNGDFPDRDAQLLSTRAEYQDWNNHHKYEVGSVVINQAGYGHLTKPDVSIVATDATGSGANAVTTINSTGSILSISVTDTGKDYTTTPLVVITGTGSSPTTANYKASSASPRMVNNKVRKVKTTLRFDRITYSSDVVDWQPGTIYPSGSYVSYQGQGYLTTVSAPASSTFDKTYFAPVQSGTFSNANDRINAFYSPTASMVPKVLSRLMTGLDNPQVTSNISVVVDTAVQGGGFTGTAIPAGQFVPGEQYIITTLGDTNWLAVGAFSNRVGVLFTANAAGSGSGKAAIAISSDAFANISGISAESITVNGGAFVYDIFSHAPEELLPGITYDALSIKVRQRNSNTAPNPTETWLYRRFIDMNRNPEISTTITDATTTTLAQPLDVNDTTITVADPTAVPDPNVAILSPGIIAIGGERIEYYTKNGNILGQLRRGVGGTSTPLVHPVLSKVESLAVTTALYT